MSSKFKVVLITGKARAGKDTAYEFLRDHLKTKRIPSEVFSFATPLKSFCIEVLGLEYKHCHGTTEEKNSATHLLWSDLPLPREVIETYRDQNYSTGDYMTGREVMEIFGSYICRAMYTDCWAKATKQRMVEYMMDFGREYTPSNYPYLFITDCRFPNEIEVFRDMNPTIIHLTRNPQNRQTRSETALDNFDWSGYHRICVDNHDMSIEMKNVCLQRIADSAL